MKEPKGRLESAASDPVQSCQLAERKPWKTHEVLPWDVCPEREGSRAKEAERVSGQEGQGRP